MEWQPYEYSSKTEVAQRNGNMVFICPQEEGIKAKTFITVKRFTTPLELKIVLKLDRETEENYNFFVFLWNEKELKDRWEIGIFFRGLHKNEATFYSSYVPETQEKAETKAEYLNRLNFHEYKIKVYSDQIIFCIDETEIGINEDLILPLGEFKIIMGYICFETQEKAKEWIINNLEVKEIEG